MFQVGAMFSWVQARAASPSRRPDFYVQTRAHWPAAGFINTQQACMSRFLFFSGSHASHAGTVARSIMAAVTARTSQASGLASTPVSGLRELAAAAPLAEGSCHHWSKVLLRLPFSPFIQTRLLTRQAFRWSRMLDTACMHTVLQRLAIRSVGICPAVTG